ncbi:MAG: hypothetical protein PHV13_02960 [Candidatus ainarchaeum sp.]|nr:hypothetical protein [Candidatus ainarchaeum sp.]
MTDVVSGAVEAAKKIPGLGTSLLADVLWMFGGAAVVGVLTVYVMPMITKVVPQLANWTQELQLVISLALAAVFMTVFKNDIGLKLSLGAAFAAAILVAAKWAASAGIILDLTKGISMRAG